VLARRTLMVRYRQTFVGAAWAVLEPLLLMLTFTVFFGLLGRTSSDGIPYPVFFLSGLVVWQVIGKVVGDGSNSVVAGAGLVNRVYFPRAYFPIAATLSILADLAVDVIVLGVIMAVEGVVPGREIVFAPLAVLIGLGSGLGLAFLLSAVNVVYRDVSQMLPILIRLWFFSSPIMYSVSLIPPEFQPIYYLNPAAVAIAGFRWALTGTTPPPPEAWVIGSVVSATLLVIGYVFFRRREPTFSDTV
jgi:lipopolysaccharide transport system permease protein